METIELTVPITSLRVLALSLDWEHKNINITVGSGETVYHFHYNQDEAETLMVALNKANLTIKSLHRRVLEKLIADGKLVGAITGAPD